MKTKISLLLLLVSLNAAYPQGTVLFANASTTFFYTPADRLVRFDPITVGTGAPNPFGTNNAPVVGTNFLAQLYYGASTASAESLIAVSSAPTTFRPSTAVNPGAWFGGTRTLDGFVPGEYVNLQVRVWDSVYGSTFEATGGDGIQGVSAVFLYIIPQSGPPVLLDMDNFRGFTIGVPEPSVMSLFAAAAVLWKIFPRR